MTLVRLICAGICLFALLCLDADAQGRKRVPRFEDYPVKEIHQGKSAKLVLETEDQRSASTYYQAIADGGTSFAGPLCRGAADLRRRPASRPISSTR